MTKAMTDLCNRAASDVSLHDLVVGWLRYNELRKVTPGKFLELTDRNIRGENFDGMVDALVIGKGNGEDTDHAQD